MVTKQEDFPKKPKKIGNKTWVNQFLKNGFEEVVKCPKISEVEGCYNSMGIALDMNTALPSLNTALDLN